MQVRPTHIITLAVKKVVEEAQQGRGRYVSFRLSKLADEVLRELKQPYSKVLARYLIKHVLDVLCKTLNCEKRDTSRGMVYAFERQALLSFDPDTLVKLCVETS